MSQNAAISLKGDTGIGIDPYLEGIQARAEDGTKARKLPDQTIQDFSDAGLFRSFLPKKWGGLALAPQEFFKAPLTHPLE